MERLRDHYLHEAEYMHDPFTEDNEEMFVIRVSGLNANATENFIRQQYRGIFVDGMNNNLVRIVSVPPGRVGNNTTGCIAYVQYRTRYALMQCIRQCYSAQHYGSNLLVERVLAEEMQQHR